MNSDSFVITHFQSESSLICSDCSISSSYCLGNGNCECFAGVSNSCPCSTVSINYFIIFYFIFSIFLAYFIYSNYLND